MCRKRNYWTQLRYSMLCLVNVEENVGNVVIMYSESTWICYPQANIKSTNIQTKHAAQSEHTVQEFCGHTVTYATTTNTCVVTLHAYNPSEGLYQFISFLSFNNCIIMQHNQLNQVIIIILCTTTLTFILQPCYECYTTLTWFMYNPVVKYSQPLHMIYTTL